MSRHKSFIEDLIGGIIFWLKAAVFGSLFFAITTLILLILLLEKW